MLTDIKKVLKEKSNINIEQFPLVNFLFENPDQASCVANIYGPILNDMELTRNQLISK